MSLVTHSVSGLLDTKSPPHPVTRPIASPRKRQIAMETMGVYSHATAGFKKTFSGLCLGLGVGTAKGALANWAPSLA